MPEVLQRSFDDLGTPLHQVTFCVLDLETTGSSAATDTITEIGAVRTRAGECGGTFQTLVDPGRAIPPAITVLTGITESMVVRAPRVESVLPALVEFVGGAVLVGHNLRFDVSFLDAALVRAGYPRLRLRTVDTCALARRLVREEVPDCRLSTLANRLRLEHRPTHRALDDALATCDLLHFLLERAAAYGVLGLDDLLALPRTAGHPQAAKLRLTTRLPRAPGVYVFRDRGGRPLYVGKATDLRSRVRSYFGSDDRRKIGPMLREADRVDHIPCRSPLEAAVLEVRLLHALLPRYNRQGTTWRRSAYVRLDLSQPFPRLSVVRRPAARPGDVVEVGPLPSARVAGLVVDAVQSAAPLRRCSLRIPRGGGPVRDAPCAAAQLGVAHCPCAGAVGAAEYDAVVARVVRGLRHEPDLLLAPISERIARLAADERYEEAALARDRAAALADALRRTRRFDAIRRAGEVTLDLPDGGGARLDRGLLRAVWGAGELPALGGVAGSDSVAAPPAPPPPGHALPADLADELLAVTAWCERNAHRLRVVDVTGDWWSPWPAVPTFRPPARS